MVISDTSTIRYLILLKHVDLLEKLFGMIIITSVVYQELTGADTPREVMMWMRSMPTWIEVRDVYDSKSDKALYDLDPGERSTIHTAIVLKADLVLLDEIAGRRAAKAKGLRITGLLGILDRAATMNLIEIEPIISRLKATNFYISPKLLQQLQEKHQIR